MHESLAADLSVNATRFIVCVGVLVEHAHYLSTLRVKSNFTIAATVSDSDIYDAVICVAWQDKKEKKKKRKKSKKKKPTKSDPSRLHDWFAAVAQAESQKATVGTVHAKPKVEYVNVGTGANPELVPYVGGRQDG